MLFANARLYADAALQIVYIALGAMGWWCGDAAREPADVRAPACSCCWRSRSGWLATLILVPILRARTRGTRWDALTTSMSLARNCC